MYVHPKPFTMHPDRVTSLAALPDGLREECGHKAHLFVAEFLGGFGDNEFFVELMNQVMTRKHSFVLGLLARHSLINRVYMYDCVATRANARPSNYSRPASPTLASTSSRATGTTLWPRCTLRALGDFWRLVRVPPM